MASRGKGIRCYGFRSDEGDYANCTNPLKAGSLPFNASSETYAHKLQGRCHCGETHGSGPARAPKSRAAPTIVEEYDYYHLDGTRVFQVVKMKPKRFLQRHKCPGAEEWIWNLGGKPKDCPCPTIQPIPFKLNELINSDSSVPVYIVEGEKDVLRLMANGFVATCNPMGAMKWRSEYDEYFAGRDVVILPDMDPETKPNDPNSLKGQKHAMMVAKAVYRTARTVKVLELPGLPDKGDVSDWFDLGGTPETLNDLVAGTAVYTAENTYHPAAANGHITDTDLENTEVIWSNTRESKHRHHAKMFIEEGLLMNGRFINAGGLFYYFDNQTRTVLNIETFEMRVLLRERYAVNSTEAFYKYLLEDLKVECQSRGDQAQVSHFAQYDAVNNLMFVDLGRGRMLRLNGQTIEEVDNGTNGILFTPTHFSSPWTYQPGDTGRHIRRILIGNLNFVTGEGAPHTPEQQQLLMLIWLLSIAFESVQPTKPLVLFLGPAGSGKSSALRRAGRMLYGPGFEVDGIRKDGESDFFVATTNNPFVAFDNVDRYIPWLEDALASSATGMRITKRVLYETNKAISYTPKAFIAMTARTPYFRRDDVSERMLPFRLEKLATKRPEFELLNEIEEQRDLLMSEYCRLLNQAVGHVDVPMWDTELRLADFGSVAMRIGTGLGVPDEVKEILASLRTSQRMFATEENELALIIDIWTQLVNKDGLIEQANDDRIISTKELYGELKSIADEHSYDWNIKGPAVLGRQLSGLEDGLSIHYEIDHDHNKRGSWWRFRRKDEGI